MLSVGHSSFHSRDHIQMSMVPCQQVSSTSHASSQHCLETLEEKPLILMLIYSALKWGMIRALCVGKESACWVSVLSKSSAVEIFSIQPHPSPGPH